MSRRRRRALTVPRTYAEMFRHASLQRLARDARAIRRAVIASMSVPAGLPEAGRMRGSVWGVAWVRDELDVIEATLRHQLDQDLDALLVADNLSVDGTTDVLHELARDLPLYIVEDRLDARYQAMKTDHLARIAQTCGARWIVPFDADELWFAQASSVGRFLQRVSCSVVAAPVHNAFPLDLDRADGARLEPDEEWMFDLTAVGRHKVAFRAHPLAVLTEGAHNVRRGGRRGRGLGVVHIPWRSRAQMSRKLRQGKRGIEATSLDQLVSRHYRVLGGASPREMDEIWSAIVRGQSVPDLYWAPVGPFRKEAPLTWSTWQGPDLAGSPLP